MLLIFEIKVHNELFGSSCGLIESNILEKFFEIRVQSLVILLTSGIFSTYWYHWVTNLKS